MSFRCCIKEHSVNVLTRIKDQNHIEVLKILSTKMFVVGSMLIPSVCLCIIVLFFFLPSTLLALYSVSWILEC